MILNYGAVTVPHQYLTGEPFGIVWPIGVVATPVTAGTPQLANPVTTCGHALAVNPCSRRC